MNTMVVQQTRFWHWFWNGLRLLTVVAMVVGMLPLDALAAPAAEAPAATAAAAPAANLLPGWMQPGPVARSATLLPAWLAEPAADPAAKLLPAWYRETTPAGAKPRPKQLDIPEALLTVNVYGPPVASLGAPATFGEVYTVVVRNNSTQIAYNFYLTATYPTFFIYDGAEQLVHSISGTLAINTTSGAGVAQWQPVTMANLAPGDAVTLTFRLRATCAAQSGQMMRVWFYYNADPPPASPVEYNEGALNITTGRGNLVIRKDPALQNLGTPDFGQPVTWTVTVQNTGLGLIYNATVTDTGGINLGQPGGDLVPAVTIPVLGINETRQFTVVGRVEACNFTNIAETAWPCGNLVGDATFTNPLRSTASILFTPQVPNVNLQITSPITEPYCTPLTRTVTITLNNTGGPAGAFRLDSALESNGYWELVPGSLPADWQYLSGSGVFSYTGGSPTGTLPAAGQAGLPVVLSFQLRPQATALCGAASGEIGFLPLYQDVCSHAPFTGTPVSLIYQSASDGAPTISVDKSGPGLVHVGELITYVITLNGSNPQSINGAITVTDLLPTPFALVSLTATNGTVTSTGQTVTWLYDPPDSGAFPQTLIYVAQVLTTTGGVCGGSNIYDNDVLARANPLCPGCAQLVDSDRVTTAIENNEGVTASSGAAGSTEVCGVNGLVISRRYEISGSMVITWTGSRFTETLGQGPGGLPGPAYLVYQAGSLVVTVNGVDYTAALTPVTTTGQLVLDLTPLQTAVPAVPTQNVTLLLTYTLAVPESVLGNAVEVDFYDWARLFLIGVSDNQACATNGAFNQALPLHLSRGDLQVGLSPLTLNRCETNRVTLSVTDNQPTRLADHIVITFTASTAEIMSARNFSYTGSLAAISPITVVTQSAIGGGLGIITFTLPANTDLNGNGTILFDVDLRCGEGAPWTAGIVFQSRCAITHGHQTVRDHLYREPGLLLFATPLQYTVREKQVIWKFFVTNNGNLTATNVQVTHELYGLAVTSYTADQGGAGISVSGTLPITTPNPAVFTVASLAPGEQRAVTVTAEVMVCNPLTVVLRARYSCFGAVCNEPQAQVNFNTPDPYLLTNNGETAALPMCDIGQIVFTTKNSSPDVTLYNLFITETLRGLLPIPGAPMTVTIEDPHHNVLATTTQFTPLQQWAGSDLLLTWRPISAPTEVLSWFLALPPLYVVRIFVPVRTSCVPPNTPQSFAAASAQGPCGQHLGYTENAVSLQTLRPDMSLTKDGQVEGGTFGKTLYATPGQTITWRLRVRNLPSDQAYVAHNVVLSDTWPAIFNFITATTAYTPHIDPASRTITWALGDVGIGSDIYFYLTGTVAVSSTACLASALNRAQLSFGCDDGCSSALVPQDSANLNTAPNLVLALAPLTFQLCENTITLTVRNQGAAAFTNTLTMTIPSGYVYDGLVSSGLTVTQIYTDPSAPRFYWDLIPGSAPNQPYSFDLVVRVVNSGTVGTCPNANGQPVTATIGYDDHPTCTDSGPFQAATSGLLNVLTPNLVIDKTPPFRTAQVGEQITWTLRMTNTGTGLAAQVLVTDVVDSSFTGVTATNGGLVTGNLITWTLTDLSANGVWTAQVSAILLSSGDNRNVVTATAYCASGCTSTSTQDSAQVTLLQEFQKNPEIQTGTIGSLVVFTFTAALPDVDALYDNVIFTDTLPTGLGYVASELRYTYDADGSSGGPVTLISVTPTLSPTYLQPGNLIWRLGTLTGSIQVAGVVTAVIRDIASNYNGVRVTNLLTMTYVDDGQPYVYTDTANVDIVEPLLHIGKSYETPSGCGATLLQDNFNRTSASPPTSWTAVNGSWNNPNGVAQQSSNNTTNALLVRSGFTADDFSYSAMIQALDASSSRGLVFRYTANNYYLVRLRQGDGGNNIQVQEIAAGTFFTLATVAITPATNRWYHVEARVETVATGLRIRVYIDGQPTLDVTDSSPRAAGSVGLYANACANNQCQFDDVLVTRLQNSACTVGANDLVTYTLTVSNQARIPGYDLLITDVIPAGTSLVTYTLQSDDPLAQVTAAPTPIPGATGTLVWQLNQLTATTPFSPLRHTALTLTVVLRVAPTISVNTFLDNQAFLSYSGQPGSGPLGVERPYSGGSHSTAIRTLYGGLTKTVAFAPPPTATLGTLVTYTLLVPATPITATYYNVVVTDVIDSRLRIEGVEFSGGTGGAASWLGQVVTATFATIPAGTQALITVTARISHEWPNAAGDANAGQTITNVAVMTSSTTPLTTSNVVSTVVGEPALLIQKTAASASGLTGLDGLAWLTYTIAVTNVGSSPAYSLHITDLLPSGISVTAQYGGESQSGPLVGPGVLTWYLSTLSNTAPANRVVLTYTAQLSQALLSSWLTNTVNLLYTSLTETIPGVRPYTNTTTATVSTGNPTVGKATEPLTLLVGDLVTYHLVFTIPAGLVGMGDSASYLRDQLPAGLWYITNSETLAWTPSGVHVTFTARTSSTLNGAQVLTWTFAQPITSVQEAPTVITLSFICQVVGLTVDTLTPVFTGGTLHPVSDTVTLVNRGTPVGSATVTNTVIQPHLALDKESTPPSGATVGAGDRITYTLTVTNSGHGPAYDIILSDTLPSGLTYLTATLTGNAPATLSLLYAPPVSATGLLTWQVNALWGTDWNAGQPGVAVLTFVAEVTDTIGANLRLTNTAAIPLYDSQPGDGPGPYTPDEREYTDGTDSVYHKTVDAAIRKVVTPLTATLGNVITYVIVVPATPITATLYDVTVTDSLDPRLQLHTVTAGPDGVCSPGLILCYYPAIPAGQQRLITVTAVLSDPLGAVAGEVLTNLATLSHTTDVTTSNQPTFTVVEPQLLLVKASEPPTSHTVGAGQGVTYTVTITNIGTSPAYRYNFEDQLPIGMQQLTPTLLSVTLNGNPVATSDYVSGYLAGLLSLYFEDWVPIPVNGVLQITYVAYVDPDVPAGVDLTNHAAIRWISLLPDTEAVRHYGPLTDSTTIHSGYPALDLEKQVEPDHVEAGEWLTYTLTVTNTGLVSATAVVITDIIPVNTTFVTATLPHLGPDAGGVISWPLGTLDIGVPRVVTLVVQAMSPLTNGIYILNTAWVTCTEGLTDTDTVTTPVGSAPILRLLKASTDGNGFPLRPGDRLTYTLTVINNGNETAANVTVSDTVPAHTTYVPGSLAGGDSQSDAALPLLFWTINLLPPGTPVQLTFAVTLNLPLTNGLTLPNTGVVTATAVPTPTSDTITDTVVSAHTLAISKSAEPATVQAGDLLTYTLAYTITGDEPVYGVVVSDTTPANTTFWAAIPPAVADPGLGNVGPVLWNLGDFLPPESGIFQATGLLTLVVRLDSPLVSGTLLYNAVLITDTSGLTDTDELTTPVQSAHALSVTKSADPTVVQAGDLLTYTLAWEVTGNEPAFGVTLSDTVPVNTAYVDCSGAPCSESGGLVTWSLGDQYPPAAGAVTMVVQLNSPLISGTVIHNAVLITDTSGLTDTDEVETPVQSSHALSIQKTATPAIALAGGWLTYTLFWQVTGNEPAFDVTLSDTLPLSTAFQTCSGALCGLNGETIFWYLGPISPVASGLVTLVVQVDPAVPLGAVLTNTVLITDSTDLTDTDTLTTPTETSANVAVTKTDDPDPVIPGTVLVYTLHYVNEGPSEATDVVIHDWLPPEVDFVSAAPVPSSGPNPLVWPLGALPAGAQGTIVVTATVRPEVRWPFTNTVTITTTTPGDHPDDNTDDELTTPLIPGLQIEKTVLPGLAAPHMPFTYVIRLTNTGQITFNPVVLTDTLPAGFHYQAGTGVPADPDLVAEPLLVWQNLGTLAPGQALTVSFAVTVERGILGTFYNVATVEGDHPGGTITDTDDVPIVIQDPAIDMSKQLIGYDTDLVAPNFITFTIEMTNIGPTPINVLPLVDHYDPYYLSFATATPYPDEPDDDGLLTWYNLVGPAPHGFGRYLLPGQTFVVTTVFRIAHDIIDITTTNIATTTGVTDIYTNPTTDQTDHVDVPGTDGGIPTAVDLLSFRATGLEQAIRLEWATAAEINNFGFRVLRAAEPEYTRASELVFIPSLCRGNLCGATYVYTDTTALPETAYWYWLVDVDTDGRQTRHGPASAQIGLLMAKFKLYLPLVLKAQ